MSMSKPMSGSFKPIYKHWTELCPTKKTIPMSIEDLEKQVYGVPLSVQDGLKNIGNIQKADHPMLTSTTGVRNAVFGAKAWTQLTKLAVPWHILPKKTWDESHYRAETDFSSIVAPGTNPAATAMPDTEMATYAEVQIEPSLNWHGIEQSVVLAEIRKFKSEDDLDWNENKRAEMNTFLERLTVALTANVNTAKAGYNIESLDRICCSYAEQLGETYTADYADLYSHLVNGARADREAAASWTDAYVDGGTWTANRNFQPSLCDTVYQNIEAYFDSEKNKCWLTGYDTRARWMQYLAPNMRGDLELGAEITFNGIKTHPGGEGARPIASYMGHPIVASNRVVQDTLSRIYFLDMDNLWLTFAQPTVWGEMPPDVPTMYAIDRPSGVAGAYNVGNLCCHKFRSQGKIMNLQ